MGCATGVVKIIVFIFNLFFVIVGLAFLTIGILFKLALNGDVFTLEETKVLSLAPIFIIVVGSVIFLISFFGCCGAIRENTCLLTTYAVILLIILVAQISLGVFAFLQIKDEKGLKKAIFDDMKGDLEEYGSNDFVTKYYDDIQTTNKCCGVNGPDDWNWPNGTIPKTCCESQQSSCNPKSETVYKTGCGEIIYKALTGNVRIIGIVAVSIASVELLGAIFALCLSSSIRNEERRGNY